MNDRAYLSPGSGFLAVNIAGIPPIPGLALGFRTTRPDAVWSEAGVAAYARLRKQAEAMISAMFTLGFDGVAIDEGVALAVRGGDPRPQWSLLDDAAVDLFAAQVTRLASETVE